MPRLPVAPPKPHFLPTNERDRMEPHPGPINQILSWVDATIQNYMQGTYQSISGALTSTLRLVLLLYVALFGVMHLTGRLPFDVWRTTRHLLLMVLVSAFVTRWDFFALYFGNLFTQGPN